VLLPSTATKTVAAAPGPAAGAARQASKPAEVDWRAAARPPAAKPAEVDGRAAARLPTTEPA